MSYWTLVTTRNRCEYLIRTLDSILNQQLPCKRIMVLDDGSSDGTTELVRQYARKHDRTILVLQHHDMGYDIRRVVRNWNECLAEAEREGLNDSTDFTFVTADDCVYPQHYVGTLVERMLSDPLLAVASGTRGVPTPMDGWKPPEGSGRLIRNSLLKLLGFRFPEKTGYESWIVYEAMRRGFRADCINELEYEHLQQLGETHGFVEWGYMPHALGYHPLLFLGRCVQNLVSGTLPRRAVGQMLVNYLIAYLLKPSDPFFQPHDPELRGFIRSFQVDRMRKAVTRFMKVRSYRVPT